jgi:large subunit ribosomal protein L22
MGARKKEMADRLKEERKNIAFAKLNSFPTSPRKMRLVADTIRGNEVISALNILTFTRRNTATPLEKLLRSAIANWQAKNEGQDITTSNVIVKEIKVDVSHTLKRISAAPQGRAHKIRKRSNHVTIILDKKLG